MSASTPKQNARLAGIQMVSGPEVRANLAAAEKLVAAVADLGADLVLLPEYFPTIGASDADRVAASEDFGRGLIQDWLRQTAQRHGLWLVAGSLPLKSGVPGKMRNSTLLIDPADPFAWGIR